MADSAARLVLDQATKSFGPVKALEDGTITLFAGEAHALLGENGAGKSTLVKILGGVHQPDSGRLTIDGEAVDFSGPSDAQAAGVAIIYQEPSLFPDLSVAENIFLGRQPRGSGRRIDREGDGAGRPGHLRRPRGCPGPGPAGPWIVGRRPADRRDRQGIVLRGPGAGDG